MRRLFLFIEQRVRRRSSHGQIHLYLQFLSLYLPHLKYNSNSRRFLFERFVVADRPVPRPPARRPLLVDPPVVLSPLLQLLLAPPGEEGLARAHKVNVLDGLDQRLAQSLRQEEGQQAAKDGAPAHEEHGELVKGELGEVQGNLEFVIIMTYFILKVFSVYLRGCNSTETC